MRRRPRRATRPETTLPDTTLVRMLGGAVHPRRGYAAKQLAGAGARHGARFRHQFFGTARLAYRDGGHAFGHAGHAESPAFTMSHSGRLIDRPGARVNSSRLRNAGTSERSEEHTSELQSLMRISYAVFCLKKKKKHT